jgi:muramoyltetrapeptide carboxypeptidase
MVRVGIVAPGRRLTQATWYAVQALAQQSGLPIELVVHPQAFMEHGHFAGPDAARVEAFLAFANDPTIDAIWFARGGYGTARLLRGLIGHLSPVALTKVYMGYSDGGFLLAALTRLGCKYCVHGPLVADIDRVGGDTTALRAMSFLAVGDQSGIEASVAGDVPVLAFNLTILRSLLGLDWLPERNADGAKVVLYVEDIAEYTYAIDRSMFQLSQSHWFAHNVEAVRIGRFSNVPENDVAFSMTSEQSVGFWCQQVGVAVHGIGDIGHDSNNKIVPFGLLTDWRKAGFLS